MATMMVAGTNLKAQEVTITLNPGWTWISYLGTDTLDLATALGSFTPSAGDMIKSQIGNATYMTNCVWRGSISQFYPGYGYMYKSNRTEPVTLTFQVQQPAPQVVITTSEPTDITATSAIVGGIVTLYEGNHIYACGVCWDTVQMPTVDGNHISNDTNADTITDTLTELTPNTTYYLRAYVVTDYGLAYSEEQSFTTLESSINVPTGAINGLFTINENGDQVYFSQGNLQYIGSAVTPYWKFADHQWDYFGTTTEQNSNSQYVDRDLFGWGTSGYNHGAICFQPWSTSTNVDEYRAYGNENYNLFDGSGKADWGYNPIQNGGNKENIWRTLKFEEWYYVFYNRITDSECLWAQGTVNGVKGTILLPDDWNSSIYNLNSVNGGNYYSNTITADDWYSLFEANGAVFLPAARNRVGTSMYYYNIVGSYWSSSLLTTNSGYSLTFQSGVINFWGFPSLVNGFSVRLVQDYIP